MTPEEMKRLAEIIPQDYMVEEIILVRGDTRLTMHDIFDTWGNALMGMSPKDVSDEIDYVLNRPEEGEK